MKYIFIYNSCCTGRSKEKKCSSNGGAQERQDETQFTTKIGEKTRPIGLSYFVS
jgi:hypothetical protein